MFFEWSFSFVVREIIYFLKYKRFLLVINNLYYFDLVVFIKGYFFIRFVLEEVIVVN